MILYVSQLVSQGDRMSSTLKVFLDWKSLSKGTALTIILLVKMNHFFLFLEDISARVSGKEFLFNILSSGHILIISIFHANFCKLLCNFEPIYGIKIRMPTSLRAKLYSQVVGQTVIVECQSVI